MIKTVEKNYDIIRPNSYNFKVTKQDEIIMFVPNDEANRDYQAIQEWAAIDGNNIIDNGA